MENRSKILTVKSYNPNTIITRLTICLVMVLSFSRVNAQPSIFDAENRSFCFFESNRTVELNNGNDGFSSGSIHRFANVLRFDGLAIDALITVTNIQNASIISFDDDYSEGNPCWFQPQVTITGQSGGYVSYHLQLVKSGSNEEVFVKNFSLSGIDFDGINSSKREYGEFTGFTSYVLNSITSLEVSTGSLQSSTRFLGATKFKQGLVFENTCSFILENEFPVSEMSFVLGANGLYSKASFSLQMGEPAGTFTTPVTTLNPFPVAVDDIGLTANFNTGSTNLLNVLGNDFYKGAAVNLSDIKLHVLQPASDGGITLNTSTGYLSVDKNTPAGAYSLQYKFCTVNPAGRCDSANVSIDVLKADLSLTISQLKGSLFAGENNVYTITVTNNGPTVANGVQVYDTLSTGLSVVSAIPSRGAWGNAIWTIGTLMPDSSVTLLLTGKVASDATTSVRNKAVVTSTTYDPNSSNNVGIQLASVSASYDLFVNISGDAGPVAAGSPVNYVISVKNNGPSDAGAALITPSFASVFKNLVVTPSQGTWNSPVWNVGAIHCGETAYLDVSASINSAASGLVSNSATLTNNLYDSNSSNNSSVQKTQVNTSADLFLTHLCDTDTLVPGEMVTCQVQIQNNGSGNADNIQLIGSFTNDFDMVQYSANGGVTWALWKSPYLLGNLNSNTVKSIYFRGVLKNSVEEQSLLKSPMRVVSSTPDSFPDNNVTIFSFPVKAHSDLSITKSGTSTVLAGDKIIYSLTVTNEGPSDARNVVVSDTLSSLISEAEYSLDNGASWDYWLGEISFDRINYGGTLKILIRGDLQSDFSGSLLTIANVSSGNYDDDRSNNSASFISNVSSAADLMVYGAQLKSPLLRTDSISYWLTIKNDGPSTATGITLFDTIVPSIITNARYWDGTTWLPWADSVFYDALLPDSSISLNIRGLISNLSPDSIINAVSVNAESNDDQLSNNQYEFLSLLNKEVDLSIEIDSVSSVIAGDTVLYVLKVYNKNAILDVREISAFDDIELSGLEGIMVSYDKGNSWQEGNGLYAIDSIAPGDSALLYAKGLLPGNATGLFYIDAKVSSSSSDPDWSNNEVQYEGNISEQSDLSITQTLLTPASEIVAGSTVDFMLTCTNNGPSDVPRFVVTDLPSDLFSSMEVSWGLSFFRSGEGIYRFGALEAGGVSIIYVSGVLNTDLDGGYSNQAVITTSVYDPLTSNDTSVVSFSVSPRADLELTYSSLENPVIAGDTIIVGLTIKNNGPSDADSIQLSGYLSSSVSGIIYSVDNGDTWNSWGAETLIGDIENGASKNVLLCLPVSGTVANGTLVENTFYVSSLAADWVYENNSVTIQKTILAHADLQLSVQLSPIMPGVGESDTLIITITNNGPSTASSVLVKNVVPDVLTFASVLGNGFVLSSNTWSVGTIASQQTKQLKIVGTPNTAGPFTSLAYVSALQTDPDESNNTERSQLFIDQETVYTLSYLSNIDKYTSGYVLASANDPDGSLSSATLIAGALPAGLSLNNTSGKITVVTPSGLQNGIFLPVIKTIDAKGGVTTQTLKINIEADSEAHYRITAPKNRDNYATGEILATVSDADGFVLLANYVSGTLPAGISVNSASGIISVGNKDALQGGNHSFAISTTDVTGGITEQTIVLEFTPDNEAVYAVTPAKALEDYRNGDVLASVTDADSLIISAAIVDGSLPEGTQLNALTGEITVFDSTLLAMALRPIMIQTIDGTGGLTRSYITLKLGLEQVSVYTVMPAKNVDSYQIGDSLAYASMENGKLVLAELLSGEMPAGAQMNTETGLISVVDSSLLSPGFYYLNIRVTDNFGNISTQNITIEINADNEAAYTVEPFKNITSYQNNDLLATVFDADGNIVSAEVVSGSIPEGVLLNVVSGTISVIDTSSLTAGDYQFDIKTTDETGGVSYLTVNLSFMAADLKIEVTPRTTSIVSGESVTFSVLISNNGPSLAKSVYLSNVQIEGVSSVDFSTDSGATWATWPVFENHSLGNIFLGESLQILIRLNMSNTFSGSMQNTFTVSSQTDDLNLSDNSAVSTTSVIPSCDLSVSLSDSRAYYMPGTLLQYKLVVANNSRFTAEGVTVVNNAPAGTTIPSWSATGSDGAEFTVSGNAAINEQVSLPSMGIITYKVFVLVPESFLSTLTNTASIVVPETIFDPDLTNNLIADVDELSANTQLTATKTSTQTTVAAGEKITYTIHVVNDGPNKATDVVITDELPEDVTFESASTGGLLEDGVVKWSVSEMAVGSSFAAKLEVWAKSSLPEGTIIRNVVAADCANAEEIANSNAVDITVTNSSLLAVEKIASQTLVEAGTDFSYSIQVTNNGPSDISSVIVTDTLPDGLVFASASDGGMFSGGVVTWVTDSIANGESTLVSLTVKADEQIVSGTVIENIAVAKGRAGDLPVESTPAAVTVNSPAILSITKDAPSSVMAGDFFAYTLKVENIGLNEAARIVVTDTLPDGIVFSEASGGGVLNGSVVTWTLGTLAVNASAEYILKAQADADLANGSLIKNRAAVSASNTKETYYSNETSTTVVSIPLLAIDDLGTPVLGTVGGTALPNVLGNDTYGGNSITLSDVSLEQLSSTAESIYLDTLTGSIMVEKGTPAGQYLLTYRICLVAIPDFCAEAEVTVEVTQPSIEANDDTGITIDNMQGGVAVANVTANDLLNGFSFTMDEVTLNLVQPAPVSGIYLDTETGQVYVDMGTEVGDYQITYSLCDAVNPSNCDNAVVTLSVTDNCDLMIPTGFSPNADNINDRFKIRCIGRYPDATIEIYNRWGNLVYKKSGYGNEGLWGESDAWWDGSSTNTLNLGKGKLPAGIYFYLLYLGKGDKPLTGSVFLNR